MDLPQIGAHCSLPTCNVLDFLPTPCICNKSFCSEHIVPDRHHCPALSAKIVQGPLPTFSDPLLRCSLDQCKKLSLREKCTSCQESFCADHRHPETHQCPSETVVEDSVTKKAAKAPESSSYVPSKKFKATRQKPPTDPGKLAQWRKLEVMKMRHRASSGDPKDNTASLPPDQRLHVKVMVENTEHIFWFRKSIVTGRALDLLVQRLKLTFSENSPLSLLLVPSQEGESISIANDQLLADQVEDGCTLIVCPAVSIHP